MIVTITSAGQTSIRGSRAGRSLRMTRVRSLSGVCAQRSEGGSERTVSVDRAWPSRPVSGPPDSNQGLQPRHRKTRGDRG